MNSVQEYIDNFIPTFKKRGDWKCFNCPCCYTRMGESRPDSKARGGIKYDGDSIIYNCFNCHFSWMWSPGYPFVRKMKMFFEDLGLSFNQMMDLQKLINNYKEKENSEVKIERIIRDIPDGYKSIIDSINKGDSSKTLCNIYSYIMNRNPNLMYWSDLKWKEGLNSFLIPCYENEKVVGYILRSLNDLSSNKYINYIPSGYIYNIDTLYSNRKYHIITEGPIDAISINSMALLTNTFTNEKLKKILQIKKDKEIIVLADRDKGGEKIINQILDENLPFSVAFPNWEKGIKDAADAVIKYGRLYTLDSIIKSKVSDKLLINVKKRGWINDN